jgi:hypothetical protein
MTILASFRSDSVESSNAGATSSHFASLEEPCIAGPAIT